MKRRIGIWGPRSAGKTTYLSVLYHDCLKSGWTVKAANAESDEFRLKNYRLLFGEGLFPIATPPQDVDIYTYDISQKKQLGVVHAYQLVLADASGEWFEDPVKMQSRFPDKVNPYERLKECYGLVLLLDPGDVKENQTSHYITISRALGALCRAASDSLVNKPIAPWMAICFTKMDRDVYQYNIDLDGEEMIKFARNILGKHIYQDILNACDEGRVKFFGCSSIGRLHNGTNDRSNIVMEESGAKIIDPGRIAPKNIFKPIDWLLKQKKRP